MQMESEKEGPWVICAGGHWEAEPPEWCQFVLKEAPSLIKMMAPVCSFTGLKMQEEIMRESFWRPLWLLNASNSCGLLKREAIK